MDCLLSLFGVKDARKAGLKGVINLLAPFATFLAMVLIILVWWVVRRLVYAAAAECASREMHGRWHRRAAVIWCCLSTASFADIDRADRRFLFYKWLRSKASTHVPLDDYLFQGIMPVALITAFFWYPSIARIVLGMRACMTVCGTRYWVMDMSLECPRDVPGKPQAAWTTAVTIPAAIITGGLPLLVLVVLHVWRSHMEDPQFLCWFGFLCSDYSYHSSDALQQPTVKQEQPVGESKSNQCCLEDRSDTANVQQLSCLDQNIAAPSTPSSKSTCR